MSIDEFSNNMDIALNSYSIASEFGDDASVLNVVLDEYEKSVFLTQAQQEIFVNLYNGKNIYGDFFEGTEELRRYLDTLVVNVEPQKSTTVDSDKFISDKSSVYILPSDLAFITLEQVTYGDSGDECIDGFTAKVYPVTQDEYDRVKDNPFRGPTKYKALRLDYGKNKVEIVSAYPIKKYYIRYLKKPSPIILTDLPEELAIDEQTTKSTECEMNPLIHKLILDRAVTLAVQAKSIGINNKNNKSD